MPRDAFIIHKDQMNTDTVNALSRIMKPCLEAGTIEKVDLDALQQNSLPPPTKKTVKKNDYPDWFEELWKKLPIRINKPETLRAVENALKRGYTVEDIEKGIPGYAQEERRRSSLSDYQKHAPHRWVEKDRFLDGQSHDPGVKRKSKSDLMVEEVEGMVNYLVSAPERLLLLALLDEGDISMDTIRAKAGTWTEGNFTEWLRTLMNN